MVLCVSGPSAEAGVQEEGDASGLAAPRRVGILEIGDPNAEAGGLAVPHFDALAWRCRCKRTQVSVGDVFSRRALGFPAWLWATVGLQTRAARTQMHANVCT
jgi:hypothetical protein